MRKYNELEALLEFEELDTELYKQLEYDYESKTNTRLYKHLKRILSNNTIYLDFVEDDIIKYISTITNDFKLAKALLILIILKAMDTGDMIDITMVKEYLLENGKPSKMDLKLIKKEADTKTKDWHRLWVEEYE